MHLCSSITVPSIECAKRFGENAIAQFGSIWLTSKNIRKRGVGFFALTRAVFFLISIKLTRNTFQKNDLTKFGKTVLYFAFEGQYSGIESLL